MLKQVVDISTAICFKHSIPVSGLSSTPQLLKRKFGFGEKIFILVPFFEKQIFPPLLFILFHRLSTRFSTSCQPFFITLPTIFSAISRQRSSTRESIPAAGVPVSPPSIIDWMIGISPRNSTPLFSAYARAPPRPKM